MLSVDVPQIECGKHSRRTITNYCFSETCLRPLCPQCIESHIKSHSAKGSLPDIQTITSSASRCIKKLKLALEHIEKQYKPTRKNQESQNELMQQKKRLQLAIEKIFSKLLEKNGQPSYSSTIKQTVSQIQTLITKIQEPESCLSSIRQTFSLDLSALWESLRQQKDSHYGLKISNFQIEQIQNLIKQLGKGQSHSKKRQREGVSQKYSQQSISEINSPRAKLQQLPAKLDSPVKSKKRLQITAKSQDRYLHFTSPPNKLFVMKLPSQRFTEYQVKYQIPVYSRSVFVQKEEWTCYQIGGISKLGKKLADVVKINDSGTTHLGLLRDPRSSFSVAKVRHMIYVVGGYGNTKVLDSCQAINTITGQIVQMNNCRVACYNASLVPVGKQALIKAGGSYQLGKRNFTIEVFGIKDNKWTLVDPIIQSNTSNPILLSSMGGITINQTQLFFFGGYDEERYNQAKRSSFVLTIGKPDYKISHVDQFTLPYEEGFWSDVIIFDDKIWALQNVADPGSSDNDLIPDKRRVLRFDGSRWQTVGNLL